MRYVLATDWRDHWDGLAGGLTSFTVGMLKPPMYSGLLRAGIPAVFLSFTKPPREPRKAWSGKIVRIEHNPDFRRITVRVKLTREIRFPRKYAGLEDGWYVEDPEPSAGACGLW